MFVIPGIASPAMTWASVGEQLGRKYDTFIVDVRGRGLSESGPELAYDLSTCARDIDELAKVLGLRTYSVLGHSMGGRIAMRHAHLYVRSVVRLVLVDPPLSGPGRRPYRRSLDDYLAVGREALAGRLDFEAMRARHPNWSEMQLRSRVEWLHTCDEAAIARSLASFNEEDVHADLRALSVPILLIAGGDRDVIDDTELDEARSSGSSLRILRIESAGHQVQFDAPEAFFSAVFEFLDGEN